MTKLNDLTEEQFLKLKASGMLYEIYPEAPENFKNIKGKIPDLIENPDLTNLKKLINDYISYVSSKDYCDDNDYEYYIYEEVMNMFFGKGKFFDYLKTKHK